MNQTKNKKFPLYTGIFIILLLIFLRFGLFFLKSDGFSGLSMLLPALLLCFIIFALCTSAFFFGVGISGLQKTGRRPDTLGSCSFYCYAFYRVTDLLSAPFRNKRDLLCLCS